MSAAAAALVTSLVSSSGTLLAVKPPPNPNDVVGGWVAFVVVLAMGAAVVFLYFSLKKQLGKVNFKEEPDPREVDQAQEPRATDPGTDRPNGTT
jgi:cytochrome c-type biogenesis protein CcmH/NrfF